MASISLRRPSSALSHSRQGFVRRVLDRMALRRSLIALSRLDARLLEDVGITPEMAHLEVRDATAPHMPWMRGRG